MNCAAGLLLAALSGSAATAGELTTGWARPGPRARVELRSLMTYAVNYDTDPDVVFEHNLDTFSWTRARLLLDWAPWDWLRAEVQAEQNLIFSTYGFVDNPTYAEHIEGAGRTAWLGPPVCGLVPGPRPDMTVLDFSRPDAIYRLADARWRWERTENLQAALRLDRINLRLGTPDTHLIIGRQAVELGSGWLWNPLDVFEAFDPRVIDRDHRYGVDAARLRVALGSQMHAELIGAAGRGQAQNSEPPPPGLSWYGSALLARFAGRFDAWTLAVQAGKVYAGYQAGLEVGARLGIWRLKGQGAYYLAAERDMLEDHASAVAGLGVEPLDGLRVTLEYFYNGANHGDRSASWLFRNLCSRSMHSAANMLGLDLSWTFAPGWHVGLLSLAAPGERAAWFQPAFQVQVSEGFMFRAGAMLTVGGRPNLTSFSDGYDPGSGSHWYVTPVADLGTHPSTFFFELVLSSG